MNDSIKMTVRLPDDLHRQLKRRSQVLQESLNTIIVETLRNGLHQAVYENQEERTWHALRESGIWEPLGSAWLQEIQDAPDVTHEQLRASLQGIPPLSEIIIEERGPQI